MCPAPCAPPAPCPAVSHVGAPRSQRVGPLPTPNSQRPTHRRAEAGSRKWQTLELPPPTFLSTGLRRHAASVPPRLGLRAEKCASAGCPAGPRVGSGDPDASAQSVGQTGDSCDSGEWAPPRPGAPAAHFSTFRSALPASRGGTDTASAREPADLRPPNSQGSGKLTEINFQFPTPNPQASREREAGSWETRQLPIPNAQLPRERNFNAQRPNSQLPREPEAGSGKRRDTSTPNSQRPTHAEAEAGSRKQEAGSRKPLSSCRQRCELHAWRRHVHVVGPGHW